MSQSKRSIERTFKIAAQPSDVWKAITEAQQISRWFAPNVESEPGVGGVIKLRWDPTGNFSDCHILEWEPAEHLRMTWRDAPGGEHELPVDIRLERADGGTILRLVHSGFLSDASWDEEFESHGRGWSYELRILKYYLEQQFGRSRQFLLKRLPIHGDPAAAWRNIIGPTGTFEVDVDGVHEGDGVTLGLPTGQLATGKLIVTLADKDFATTADLLHGGVFRFAVETFNGQPEIWIWALSWYLLEEQLERLMSPCFDAVERSLEQLRQAS